MSVKSETTQNQSECIYTALQQPAAMSEEGNMATNWREWKLAFDYYLIAAGKENATSKEKCALFLHVIGKGGRDILEELDLEDKEKTDYEKLVAKFALHCDPTRNVNYERHVFFETYQREDSFDKYLSALKFKSKSCEFGQLRSSLILTQIIRGLKDSGMRERLLAKTKLNLEEAVTWCRAAESASKQSEACGGARAAAGAAATSAAAGAELALEAVRAGGGRRPFSRPAAAGATRQQQGYRNRDSAVSSCDNCGRKHGAGDKCSARSVKCYRCDKTGHFARLCRARFVAEIEDEEEIEDCAEIRESLLCSLSVDEVGGKCDSWFQEVLIDNVCVNFKLDSGAEASIMSFRAFKEAGFDERILKKNNCILREVSKAKLPVLGYFEPVLSYNKVQTRQKMYVLNLNCTNLLGIRACRELKLIVRNEKIGEISEINIDESVFEGLGCLPTIYKIQVDNTVPPVVNASRKVPIKIMPRLKQELENMLKLQVIVKEDAPTDWVSNIVIVEKPDKLRICLDPYHLNKAVRRCHFQLPTLEEITSNLSGAKVFSKLDAKNGFWMLRLDEESSRLCTFATPFGRYRWLRMPFGINCAPEIFHHEMYKIFSMTGVEIFADDILVWGRNKTEHDRRLKEIIRRAIQYGVKFNKTKCVFSASEVNFLGHTLNSSGISPMLSRVRAINNIVKPTDRKELERFLGMTNYLSRFISSYSTVASPLRSLLKKDIEFEWAQVHDNAFIQLKTAISAAPVLRYYSPDEQVTVSVDASSYGLGACLLQGGRPVAYAARTLTPTEKRWAQIEKEMLAIYFGCVRFHQYIYGHSEIIVESDHKPLEIIFRKALNETPPRLQRMLLKLQAYCLNVVYKPGRYMHIADALSRAAVERGSSADGCEGDVTVHVNAMFESVDATSERLQQIKSETSKDSVLSAVINYYFQGWPNDKNQVAAIARPYWPFRQDLHDINGILFRNDRVVIPGSLRKEMLKRIHEGHLGIEKCKKRARDAIWWPGMGAEIEECVQRCEPCQRHRAAQPREPLAPHPVPRLPWEVLAADLFELDKLHYLLVVDYYSKYVEVVYLPNLRSDTVIAKMKGMFSRFGIPKKIVTDNGTQFTSAEFTEFSRAWEFNHVTSSPLYPRSNGLAERNVQTIKRLFKKATEDKTEWQLALLNFRNTPVTGEDYSPAQLLMGRLLNTRLPVAPQALLPKLIKPEQVREVRHEKCNKVAQHYNKGTKPLAPLGSGEQVRMKDGKVWKEARVVQEAGDRSYWVKVNNGGTYRRNRAHIIKPSVIKAATHNRSLTGSYDFLSSDVSYKDTPSVSQPRVSLSTGGDRRSSVSAAPAPAKVTRSGRVVNPPDRFVCT